MDGVPPALVATLMDGAGKLVVTLTVDGGVVLVYR
jgi:hypothetical protein